MGTVWIGNNESTIRDIIAEDAYSSLQRLYSAYMGVKNRQGTQLCAKIKKLPNTNLLTNSHQVQLQLPLGTAEVRHLH